MFSDRIFPTPDNPVCSAILEPSKDKSSLPHYTQRHRDVNTLYVTVSCQVEVGVKFSLAMFCRHFLGGSSEERNQGTCGTTDTVNFTLSNSVNVA